MLSLPGLAVVARSDILDLKDLSADQKGGRYVSE